MAKVSYFNYKTITIISQEILASKNSSILTFRKNGEILWEFLIRKRNWPRKPFPFNLTAAVPNISDHGLFDDFAALRYAVEVKL